MKKMWRKSLKKKRLCILKHFLPFLDNLRVSIFQQKYTSKHIYPSIRVSPTNYDLTNSFHNLERISLAGHVDWPNPWIFSNQVSRKILVVNWSVSRIQETDEYQETELEECHVFCLWVVDKSRRHYVRSRLYLCRNSKIEVIF